VTEPASGAILGFDTATPATAVAVLRPDGKVVEAHDIPQPGVRPGHATRLLPLVFDVLERASVAPEDVTRVAVGTGPGSFTGLRIGIATARGLAQGWDVEMVGVSTIDTLAAAAPDRAAVLVLIDARRGELYSAAFAGGETVLEPAPRTPAQVEAGLAAIPCPALAIGDGAVGFRGQLEGAGIEVPPDPSPLHRVSAAHLCRLARRAAGSDREAVLPDYLRRPDAELSR
jgi:tRNA threonylcarbamoyladenosine biosynthesis protein TsaB